MAISQVSDITTNTSHDQPKTMGKKELDRSDFMQLFITQLQYQDPTKPMDSYEVASQLAQFSSLEATLKMSESMDNLLSYQQSQNNLQLLSLLDADIIAQGNAMSVKDGAAKPAEFVLSQPAQSCVVSIYDEAGNLLQQIDLGPLAAGVQDFAWDGKNFAGNQVQDGMYRYEVQALDPLGNPVDVESRMRGTVTGVRFDSGQAVLTVDDHVAVDVGTVVSVNGK